MGILSFLTKKSAGDRNGSGDPLRPLAYNTAAVGAPPVRGAYPVAGNGPHSLETISKSHVRLLGVRPSVSASSFAVEHAAPAPEARRRREESVERPRTAPGARPLATTAAPRPPKHVVTTTRISPPVSLRNNQRPGPLVALAAPRKISHDTAAAASLASSPARSRSSSVQSATEKRFKDILDAQSEFKPADFRGRVKASGARDYGEDVAERNLGENGVDLESPHVQAFYAGSGHSPVRRASVLHDSRPSRSDSSVKSPAMSLSPSVYHHPAASLAASYPKFPVPHFLPEDVDEAADSHPPPGGRGQRSRPTTTSHHKKYVLTHREPQELTRELPLAEPGLETDSSAAAADARPGSSMGKARSRVTSTVVVRPPPTPQSRSRTVPRDSNSIHVAKRRPGSSLADFAADFAADDDYPEAITFSAWNSPRRPSSSPRRSSAVDGSAFVPAGRKQSLQAFQPTVPSSIGRRGSAPALPSLAPTLQRRRSVQAAMKAEQMPQMPGRSTGVEASAADADDGRVPLPRSDTSPPKRPCSEMRIRAQSLTSAAGARTSDEISEIITRPRRNSARKWSLSSATLNPSDAGSSVFPRSRSGTTTSTSVDLSNHGSSHPSPTETTSPGRKHSGSLSGSKDKDTAPDLEVEVEVTPRLPPPPPPPDRSQSQFNIDDYVSSDSASDSDSDSFLGTPLFRPRGPGEEELLFHEDGYGPEAQLPGLFESACPPPDIPLGPIRTQTLRHALHRPVSTPSLSGGATSRRARRRYTLDTGAHSDSDDEDDKDDEEEEYAKVSTTREREREREREWEGKPTRPRTAHASTTTATTRGKGATFIISGQGHAHAGPGTAARIPEGKEGDECRSSKTTDIAAAVRLRKEVKARERAQNSRDGGGSGGSSRRRKARIASLVTERLETDDADLAGVDG